MKKLLQFACVITLFITTGCLVSEGGHRRHGRIHGRADVIVTAPAVVVAVPTVVVRPPVVIVR